MGKRVVPRQESGSWRHGNDLKSFGEHGKQAARRSRSPTSDEDLDQNQTEEGSERPERCPAIDHAGGGPEPKSGPQAVPEEQPEWGADEPEHDLFPARGA